MSVNNKFLTGEGQGIILEDMFKIYLQPIYNIDTMKIIKAEALVRTNKFKGKQTNDSIDALKIVDKHGMHLELDKFVLGEVLGIIDKNKIDTKIAVNISKQTMAETGAIDDIIRDADKYSKIQLEINENTNFKGETEMDNMLKLSDSDVDLAIDDFGFGDTSIELLGNYRINTVKLDKIFLQNITERKIKILSETIKFIQNLGMEVIVEGVETKRQLDILKNIGKCNVQGYMLGMPISVEQYIRSY